VLGLREKWMAIYHLHVGIIQRSKGKHAIAASAYRRAAKLLDQRMGKTWNYQNKPNVIHCEMMVPTHAPAWAKALIVLHATDPSTAAEQLWNLVESSEKRIDSQLAREVEFALPIELDVAQNIALARSFIQDQFVLQGMIADWAVHWDEGNPHVHVLLTMRRLTETGFGTRALEWNHKSLLINVARTMGSLCKFPSTLTSTCRSN
jgi:ATP-dependent exoDNAse (exonuclease V) alpha subunit